MSSSALRPLSVGEILDGAFAIYRRHFLVLTATAFLIQWPIIVLEMRLPLALVTLLQWPLIAFSWGAAIGQVNEAILGRRPTFGGGLRVGLRRFLPVMAAMFVVGFLIAMGLLALVVPGIILFITLFAVMPVVVIEGDSRTPLQRSRALARGSWRKILIVRLIAGAIAIIPTMAVGVGATLTSTLLLGNKPSENPDLLTSFLTILVQSVVMPFSVAVETLLYYDQRVRKEGLDVEVAAAALKGLEAVPGSPPPAGESPGAPPGAPRP